MNNDNIFSHAIRTPLNWDDLVVNPELMKQLTELNIQLKHVAGNEKNNNRIRALFYGPAGTGKTLSATLLAKASGREIYRIDLSAIVSKYTSETEKDLKVVFQQAASTNAILLFDEADALFGKRTDVKDSNDRYANTDNNYLLKLIDDFPGTIIFSATLKANVDEDFLRRFHPAVYFPIPDPAQRKRLWENNLPKTKFDADVDLKTISEKYPLTGGNIANISRNSTLAAEKQNSKTISNTNIIEAIHTEQSKEKDLR